MSDESAVYGARSPLPPAPGQYGADPARPYGQDPQEPPRQSEPQQPEPYLGSRRDRHFSEWGQPDEALLNAQNHPDIGPINNASMPQPRDFPGLIHMLAGAALLWPRGAGMNMIRSATFATAFWDAYQKGHNQAAAQNYQQYRQQRQMAADNLKDSQREIHDAYTLYGPDPIKGTPGDPYKLHQALWDIANRHNDDWLKTGLRSGNEEALMNMLRGRDHSIVEMEKMAEQERRQAQRDAIEKARLDLAQRSEARRQAYEKERERIMEQKRQESIKEHQKWDPSTKDPMPDFDPYRGVPPPLTGGDVEPVPPSAPEPAVTAPAPDTSKDPSEDTEPLPDTSPPPDTTPTTTGANIPEGGPVRLAEAGRPAGVASDAPSPGFGAQRETGPIEDAARNYSRSGKLMGGATTAPKDIKDRITVRGDAMNRELDDLVADPNVKEDDVYRELAKLGDTRMANDVRRYVAGEAQTPSAAARNSPWWGHVSGLANKVDSKWNERTYQERLKAETNWTTGKDGATLTTINTAFGHLTELLGLMDKGYKPSQNPLGATVGEWWAKQVSPSGGKTGEFLATLNVVKHELENAFANTRSATVPALRESAGILDPFSSDKFFKGAVHGNMEALAVRLKELENKFEIDTGWPASKLKERFKEYAASSPDPNVRQAPKLWDELEKIDTTHLGGSGAPQGPDLRKKIQELLGGHP